MPHNSEFIIIADTSCLIILSKIEELSLLQALGNKTFITKIIKKEFGKTLPNWINVKSPADNHYQQILEMDLDPGEASAIALSFETDNTILIIDDLKGRKVAEKLSLRYAGTFGLILKAKQEGFVSSIQPILNKIMETNFRFNKSLIKSILNEAGEL